MIAFLRSNVNLLVFSVSYTKDVKIVARNIDNKSLNYVVLHWLRNVKTNLSPAPRLVCPTYRGGERTDKTLRKE